VAIQVIGNLGGVMAEDLDCHNQSYSAEFTLPPMSIIVFKPERVKPTPTATRSGKRDAKPQKPIETKQENLISSPSSSSTSVLSPTIP
jgi:hypothetical protein